MVVTPEDCLSLEESEKKQVGDFEQVIDAQLKAKFVEPDSIVTIIPGTITFKVLKEVLRLYRGAGWAIEHIPGEKTDLDTLVFSKPTRDKK
jgi:hypothetical protein